jgi:hypothetical protein
MKSVWNSDEAKLTQADATPYYRHALGPLRLAPKEGRGWMFAAGELAMTAHDLALWDESLIAQTILKPESYKQMFTEVKLKDGKGTHYGLGVEVKMRDGHRSIEHSGEVSGFVSDNGARRRRRRRSRAHQPGCRRRSPPSPARRPASVAGNRIRRMPSSRRSPSITACKKASIDRSLLAPNLSDYFTAEALGRLPASLAPLGEPLTFHQTRHEELRGGMTFRAFQIVYPRQAPRLTTYTYPDGKLEQYLISGYGRSTGRIDPTQCEEDAIAAFEYLQRLMPSSSVSVLGFSLGSGVAAAMITRVAAHRLVLCAAFTSFRAAAHSWGVPRRFVAVLPHIWRAEEALRDYSAPVLIVHGEQDRLFPVQMAADLAACCAAGSVLLVVPELSHDQPFYKPHISYWGPILSHLAPQEEDLSGQEI